MPTELDGPILPGEDPRWARLRFDRAPGVDFHDHFRGALIGGGIGDAMGGRNEGRPTGEAQGRNFRDFQPWQRWRNGPKGTITDDTQMTMWLTAWAPPRGRFIGATLIDGAHLAVNLGDDADTTGGLYGQIAGAYDGEQGIPEAWPSRMAYRDLIERYAGQLCALARPA